MAEVIGDVAVDVVESGVEASGIVSELLQLATPPKIAAPAAAMKVRRVTPVDTAER